MAIRVGAGQRARKGNNVLIIDNEDFLTDCWGLSPASIVLILCSAELNRKTVAKNCDSKCVVDRQSSNTLLLTSAADAVVQLVRYSSEVIKLNSG
nr:hyp [Cotesia vestalis bracovirus]